MQSEIVDLAISPLCPFLYEVKRSLLSQIIRVILIMKEGSNGAVFMILRRIIPDLLNVNRLDRSHSMGRLSFGYE